MSSIDAAMRFWSFQAAEMVGNVEDVWMESTAMTKEGCIDAYVTAVSAGQTHRYLVHMHHELGQRLVELVKQMR